MRNINKIIIHCSDSFFGNAGMIREWHKERGWRDIGYHFVILNGIVDSDEHLYSLDGSVELGRDIDTMGAHAYGHNQDSIGICLVGAKSFTIKQLGSLMRLCKDLCLKYGIRTDNIIGHYEINDSKPCPNINMLSFRDMLKSFFTSKGE